MSDLEQIGSHFLRWHHEEFCLLTLFPALLDALIGRWVSRSGEHLWFQRADRLFTALPLVRKYAWETVLVLEA